MSFYITLIIYIVTAILALLLLAISKKVKPYIILLLSIVHMGALFLCILSDEAPWAPLVFLCCGLILAGCLLRNTKLILLKIYLSIFPLSIFVFMFRPSWLINTLSGNDSKHTSIHLSKNYYLESQAMELTDGWQSFKLVKDYGIFYKSIKKDIVLPDSILNASLRQITDSSYELKVHYFLLSKLDTTINILLDKPRKNAIERKL
ncbi:MAG: hypothetical protein RIQ89_1761 [Bacteroidota bacterium]